MTLCVLVGWGYVLLALAMFILKDFNKLTQYFVIFQSALYILGSLLVEPMCTTGETLTNSTSFPGYFSKTLCRHDHQRKCYCN